MAVENPPESLQSWPSPPWLRYWLGAARRSPATPGPLSLHGASQALAGAGAGTGWRTPVSRYMLLGLLQAAGRPGPRGPAPSRRHAL